MSQRQAGVSRFLPASAARASQIGQYQSRFDAKDGTTMNASTFRNDKLVAVVDRLRRDLDRIVSQAGFSSAAGTLS
ncbi:hypothetical protein EV130_105427 [Rhizobium azibense]|uniref:Uncharacterized protein n=1 Tax=Rhizobium azibense TaxID=1136135 RepID=A0A4R3QWR4_9HYPH|nr:MULTISPECIES: hypothetical protein [Rhizobium]TCU25769.1 hypothetical protein EV130_105427 [Rhizobium azibense]TCU39947.1 hypothetical protein EV129_10284 [Rhizobium azibense]